MNKGEIMLEFDYWNERMTDVGTLFSGIAEKTIKYTLYLWAKGGN